MSHALTLYGSGCPVLRPKRPADADVFGLPRGGVGVVFPGIPDQMYGPKIILELYNAPHDQSERLATRFKHVRCFLPRRYASWPYLIFFVARSWARFIAHNGTILPHAAQYSAASSSSVMTFDSMLHARADQIRFFCSVHNHFFFFKDRGILRSSQCGAALAS